VFQRAVETAAVTDGEAQAKRDLVGLSNKFRDDPEGFRHASEAHRESDQPPLSGPGGMLV
jgi:hypothetical protein